MKNVKVRMVVSVGRRAVGDEFVVAWFISQALVRDGFAVVVEEVSGNET